MTIEDRYVIELDDLRAIRFDCTCGTSVSFKLADWSTIPHQCPGCSISWHHGDTDERMRTMNRLALGLRGTVALMKTETPFRVRLELDRPKN